MPPREDGERAEKLDWGEEGSDFDDGVGELAHGADEGCDEAGIELGAGAALEFREGLIGGAALFVTAVAGNGVVGIGDGDDARAERNLFAGEGFGVAGAIEKFVMVQNHFTDAGERNERLQKFSAEGDVSLHGVPFFEVEWAALVENDFGDADFADVVEDGAEANFLNFEIAHAEGFGKKRGVGRNLL